MLSTEEQARLQQFTAEELRRRFLGAHVLLRTILSWYAGSPPSDIQYIYGPGRKPGLPRSDLHFNMSHSGEVVLLAVAANGPVGADIEVMDSPTAFLDLGPLVLSEPEQRWMTAARDEHEVAGRFLQLWTAKEAIQKCSGQGLNTELSTVDALSVVAGKQPQHALTFGFIGRIFGTLVTEAPTHRWMWM